MIRFLYVPVLLFLAYPTTAGAQVKLAWKLDEGDRFFVKNVDRVRQTIKIMGTKNRQDLEQVKVTRYTLLKKNKNGSRVFEQKIEAVRIKGPGAGFDADTRVLKQFEGARFQLTLDGRGKIARIDGYDRFVKRLAKESPANRKHVRALITEDSLKTAAEELLGFTPEKEVDNGDSWRKRMTLPLGPLGTLHLTNTYTLDAVNEAGRVAKISVSGRASYTAPEENAGRSLKIAGGDVRLVKSSGVLDFDINRGRLLRLEMKQSLHGTLRATIRDAGADVEFEHDQDVSLSVTPMNPLAK